MAKRPVDRRSARAALETSASRRRARSLAADSPDGSMTRSSVRALVGTSNASAAALVSPRAEGTVPPNPQTGEVGTPGTLNTYGYITGEDYNQDLDGYPMFPFFNKMRLGDAQVNATLLMLKLPLKGARWVVKPADRDPDPQDQAIA